MTALELRQKAGAVLDQWKTTMELRDSEQDAEKRTMLTGKVNDLKKQHESLTEELRQAEAFEAAEAESAKQKAELDRRGHHKTGNHDTPEQKASKQFSLLRALRMASDGDKMDGIEAEMFQEADKEARSSGIALSGSVRIPSFIANPEQRNIERRDQTAGTGSEGGYTVATDLGGLIPILRPKLQLQALGATMLTGLVGNLDFPRQTAKSAATWEGETDMGAETTQTYDKLSMTPKRLSATVPVSKLLLIQTSTSTENFIRGDLNTAVREAVDYAGIAGASGGDNPVGILNTSGIGSVAMGTNGAVPTWAAMIGLWKQIAQDNADISTLAYLTTPGIAAQLMQTEKASNTAMFVWENNNGNGMVNGYKAVTSSQVPSNLTKGTSSSVCHAIIYGDFSQIVIGQWAGLDIVVDPYTRKKENLVELTVNSFWDIMIRHAESFAAIKDALVTV